METIQQILMACDSSNPAVSDEKRRQIRKLMISLHDEIATLHIAKHLLNIGKCTIIYDGSRISIADP